MTAQTFRAQMANNDGQWHAYVVLLGKPASSWPEYDWGRTAPVPTIAERTSALAAMGYEVVPGGEWEWTECGTVDEGASEPVVLIAAVTVRPVAGGAWL